MVEKARLTEQERIALFTMLQQWSRNQELQAQKVADWIEVRAACAVQDVVSVACQIMAREIEHWDYSDIPAEDAVEIALDNAAAALREKYGVKP